MRHRLGLWLNTVLNAMDRCRANSGEIGGRLKRGPSVRRYGHNRSDLPRRRALVGGVPVVEKPAIRSRKPIAKPVRHRRHGHDRFVEVDAARRAVELSVAIRENTPV